MIAVDWGTIQDVCAALWFVILAAAAGFFLTLWADHVGIELGGEPNDNG